MRRVWASAIATLKTAGSLYQQQKLKRVYYSGYIPISLDSRLPSLKTAPLIREIRLYQADWLFRFYGFNIEEIIDEQHPNLDQQIDPKLGYALRNIDLFPVDINQAPKELILRVPGIGIKTARMIIQARRYGRVRYEDIRRMGAAMNRAKYFIKVDCTPLPMSIDQPERIRHKIVFRGKNAQLSLF